MQAWSGIPDAPHPLPGRPFKNAREGAKVTASSALNSRIRRSYNAMKAACICAEATRGRGFGLRYSKPSRARSLMQPECEYSRSNSAAIWTRISTVERQKHPSSQAPTQPSVPVSYGTDHPSSRRRQAHPSQLAGRSYPSPEWCRRPDRETSRSERSFPHRPTAGSRLRDAVVLALAAHASLKFKALY